jgi:hypothetical protein
MSKPLVRTFAMFAKVARTSVIVPLAFRVTRAQDSASPAAQANVMSCVSGT